MTPSFDPGALRRCTRLGVAAAVVLAAVHGAAARDDSGAHQFFSAIFGGAAAQSPMLQSPAREADAREADPAERRVRTERARPLTVRRRPDRPTLVAAQGPSKPRVVPILEDATLQRGDAVMTARGVRIFVGSASGAHSPADFVSLDEAKHLSKDAASVFAALDRLPRG